MKLKIILISLIGIISNHAVASDTLRFKGPVLIQLCRLYHLDWMPNSCEYCNKKYVKMTDIDIFPYNPSKTGILDSSKLLFYLDNLEMSLTDTSMSIDTFLYYSVWGTQTDYDNVVKLSRAISNRNTYYLKSKSKKRHLNQWFRKRKAFCRENGKKVRAKGHWVFFLVNIEFEYSQPNGSRPSEIEPFSGFREHDKTVSVAYGQIINIISCSPLIVDPTTIHKKCRQYKEQKK